LKWVGENTEVSTTSIDNPTGYLFGLVCSKIDNIGATKSGSNLSGAGTFEIANLGLGPEKSLVSALGTITLTVMPYSFSSSASFPVKPRIPALAAL